MTVVEPPSALVHRVFIGINSCGQWVAREQNGLYGGLFSNRIDALRYALFENGRHPEAVIETPLVLELAIDARLAATPLEAALPRQVA